MDNRVLRLMDANANRAREALRVVEDYSRLILDDSQLSAKLKSIRHQLADTTKDILPEAILHRDIPGDVGTFIKTSSELHRESMNDVIIAAGKRLGEALRTMEEYAKTISPKMAGEI